MNKLSFIKINEPLNRHCTLKIGGNADYFAEPESEQQILEALNFATQNQLSYFVIGHGSNLLFADEGYRGVIIKLAEKFAGIKVKNNTITAQAGAWMPYVARKAQVAGLVGLEHTIGIPGNIGGIVNMNAGSQRMSIAQNLIAVRYIDEQGGIKSISVVDCEFGYRQSIFQNNKWLILEAKFQLEKGDKNQIRHTMRTILSERRKKFPRKEPNCGSVFKSNPAMYEKYGPPGQIIEDLGIKGKQIGGIQVSPKHANFFVNTGGATAMEFVEVLKYVKDRSFIKLGFQLVAEVQRVN